MTIGDKIRTLRTLKGYSQENMADILGISSIAYGDIERNKTDISYSRLEQIAKAFGKTIIEILNHGEEFANIFNYSNSNIVGDNNKVLSTKEQELELENAKLREEKLIIEKEKAIFEANHWKEKYSLIVSTTK